MSTSPARYFPGILVKRQPAEKQIINDVDNVAIPRTGSAEDVGDEALIQRLQEDIEALAPLYRRYARLVYSICLRILRNSTEAEDLVHEVFLSLHRKCKSFDAAKGSARSWIVQLAYSKCFDWRDYLLVRNRHHAGQELGQSPADAVMRRDTDPSYFILWSPGMLAAFKSLSEEQQVALQLFYFQGFTFQEIAQQRGYSYGNAKHHVYRGIEQLRSIIFDGAGRRMMSVEAKRLRREPEERTR